VGNPVPWQVAGAGADSIADTTVTAPAALEAGPVFAVREGKGGGGTLRYTMEVRSGEGAYTRASQFIP
jgi:hypothetical protein